MNSIGNFTVSDEKEKIMVRLSVIRSFVFALMVALTIAAATTTLPPTDPQQPPTLQNRGIIWGD